MDDTPRSDTPGGSGPRPPRPLAPRYPVRPPRGDDRLRVPSEPAIAPSEPAAPRSAREMAPRSLAERSERASLGRRVVLEEARAQRERPAPPERGGQSRAPAPAGPSMAERASEAVRRHRDVEAPATASIAATDEHLVASSVAVALVSRNHAGQLTDAFATWRRRVDGIDVRWFLLDLGSTDASAAEAEACRARVLVREGGLVEPMAALDLLLRSCDADLVVVADAGAVPGVALDDALAAAKSGVAAVALPAGAPTIVVLRRQAWQAHAFSTADGLAAWAAAAGSADGAAGPSGAGLQRVGVGGVPVPNGFVARALGTVDRRKRTRLRRWLGQVARRLLP